MGQLGGERRTLLVASTGGHLEQLWRLHGRFLPADAHVEWATFDDDHSRSLLAGQTVHHVGYIPPRGYHQLARAWPAAAMLLRKGGFDSVVSTGSGIALAFLPTARALGIPAHYIESAARAEGPSVTGRLLSYLPGLHLYCQYPRWADERWRYAGWLFDDYRPAPAPQPRHLARRVVVTLGTMRGYSFRRAVERLVGLVPQVTEPGAEVLWQIGASDVSDLPVRARASVPAAELLDAVRRADLVIAHAGIGSCLAALDAGKCPVLLPRRAELGEHVDNHQRLIAAELDRRGLAITRDPDELTVDDLVLDMTRAVQIQRTQQRFPLSA
jgi:UDP-N-acetylglucosamine transferase subunit ALG13